MPAIEIEQFTGGITDNYLDGDPTTAKKINNLVIDENGKLVQHPGLNVYSSLAPQIPPGNQQIDSMYYFDTALFVKSGTKLYFMDSGGTFNTLTGPSGGDAFADSELGAKCSWSEWRGHLFITPGPSANRKGGCRTVKVYKNAAGSWVLVQAGMPSYKDRSGGIAIDSDVSGTGVTYLQFLVMSMFTRTYIAKVNGVDTVFKDYGQPEIFQDRDDSEDGTNIDYVSGTRYTNKTYENYDTNRFRVETFRTRADGTEFFLAVSKRTASGPHTGVFGTVQAECVVQNSASAASGQHTMHPADIAFFYVGQQVTLDDNNSTPVTRYVIAVNYVTNVVTLSATSGGSASNDSAYVTANNSYILFEYSVDAPVGYAEGNFNDPAPPAYFTTIADSYGWYGAPVDTSIVNRSAAHRATRILQSKPGDPDGAPSGNFVDIVGDTITALGYYGQHPIAFLRNKCFRIEGRLDAFGGGGLRAVLISETEGAVCQEVTPTPFGLIFRSETGFCVTDGFQVRNLTKNHLRSTYASLRNKDKGSAAYDSKNQRAYFGVEDRNLVPAVTSKNNSAYILDIKRSGERGVFTTVSNESYFQPTALHYDSKNDVMIIGDARGYVFKFESSNTAWLRVDSSISYSSWPFVAIVWDYISCAFSFGSSRISKWMNELWLVCKNLTGSLSVDFTSYKDEKTTGVPMKTLRDRGWTQGLHKIKRNFPKGNLSCTYAQVQLKKGFVVLLKSDDLGLATFSNSSNTALIATGSWPNVDLFSLHGCLIYPEIDGGYSTGWEISAQSGDTLTLLDPGNTLPDQTSKWVIKGYPKGESVQIHSIGIDCQMMGEGYAERSGQGGNS